MEFQRLSIPSIFSRPCQNDLRLGCVCISMDFCFSFLTNLRCILTTRQIWRESKTSAGPNAFSTNGVDTTNQQGPIPTTLQDYDASNCDGQLLSTFRCVHVPQCNCRLSESQTAQLGRRLQVTLSQALLPMLLTTVATVLGLLVNLLSPLVAIQRFALFSVLVSACNFVFVLVSTPIILLWWDTSLRCCRIVTRRCPTTRPPLCLAEAIHRLQFVIVLLFLLATGFAGYQLFARRVFAPPEQPSMIAASSFLRPRHPLETFIRDQSNWFWAERTMRHYSHLVRAHLAWGFQPQDLRSVWNYDHDADDQLPALLADSRLDLTSVESRRWMLWFCDDYLRRIPFLFRMRGLSHRQQNGVPSFNVINLNPMIMSPLWCPLGRRYPGSLSNYILTQACTTNKTSDCCPSRTPMDLLTPNVSQFTKCLHEYTLADYAPPLFGRFSGFRFAKYRSTPLQGPSGFVITVLTNLSEATSSHAEMTSSLRVLTHWFKNGLKTAPAGLLGGQFVTPQTLATEVASNVTDYVHWSIACAVLMAVLLVLLSSGGSVLLAASAFVCLCGGLLVSVYTLAWLDGWSLGIVEGLVISLAAGLAIDPCIHVAIAVSRLSTRCHCHRGTLLPAWSLSAVHRQLSMLAPAVTGSSGSTAVAGLCMLFCQLQCYHQVGAFLVTLMSLSWFFCFISFGALITSMTTLYHMCSHSASH